MSVTNKMVGKVGMKDIKVSVVVPVFNTEKYLADCLKSLVNQTLKEIEIIVVIDEANPDDAELIAREYEAKYPEKVIVLEGPAGRVGDNRNFGMEYASGEFVAFVDSDDYVTSEMYEKMYHKAKSQAADIVVCGFCRVFYNENKIKNIGVGKKGGNVRKDPQILQRAEVFPWNKLFCLDFLKNNQFKFPSLKGFEDSACMYNIMLCANRIAFVNEPLYVYRWQRVGFSTHAIDARIFDAIEASRMTCDFFKAQGAYDICHKVLEKFCFDRLFYRFDYIYRDQKRRKMAVSYIRQAFYFMDQWFPGWKKNYKTSFFKSVKGYAKTHKHIAILYVYTPKSFRRWWGKKTNAYKTGRKELDSSGNTLKGAAYYLFCRENNAINQHQIFYESYGGTNASCHPFAIFLETIKQDKQKAYKHVWCINSPEEQKRLKKRFSEVELSFVTRMSKEYAACLASSKILICNGAFPSYFFKREEQVFVASWQGVPLKALGRARADGGTDNFNARRTLFHADYILSENSHMQRVYLEDYQLKDAFCGKVINNISPRDEYLLSVRKEAGYASLEELGVQIDRGKKIILYAPLWRGTKNGSPGEVLSIYSRFKAELENKIDTEQYQILIQLHYLTSNIFERAEISDGNYVPATMNQEELLAVADILISDYSSVFFDFLYTKRPILYFVQALQGCSESNDLYFQPDQLPGPITEQISQLGDWINDIESVKGQYSSDYQHWYKVMCQNESNKDTESFVRALLSEKEPEGEVISCLPDKKRILFYTGKLRYTEVIQRFLIFVSFFNLDKYDLTVVDDCSYWERRDPELISVMHQLNRYVRVVGRESSGRAVNASVKRKDDHQYLQQEVKRLFGNTAFDIVIDFSGESRFYQLLLLEVPKALKILWCQDYTKLLPENQTVQNLWKANLLKEFDYIIGRSRNARNRLHKAYGTVENREQYVYIEDYVGNPETSFSEIKIDDKTYILDRKAAENLDFEGRETYLYPKPNEKGKTFVTVLAMDNPSRVNALLEGFKRYVEDDNTAKLYILCSKNIKQQLMERILSRGLRDSVVFVSRNINKMLLFSLCDAFLYISMGVVPIRDFFVAKASGIKTIAAKFLAEKTAYQYNLGKTIGGSSLDFYNAFLNLEQATNEDTRATAVDTFNEEILIKIEGLFSDERKHI